MVLNMNRYIAAIRMLVNGQEPKIDISEMLHKHSCFYLISKQKAQNQYTNRIMAENMLNKLCVIQRFKSCSGIFSRLDNANIPYAVVKGAVLSNSAYHDPFSRHSGDIDILINKDNIEIVKTILFEEGFIQGKFDGFGIQPFTRQELLFHTAMSHQTAPFIKESGNKFCPYIDVDVNFDIMWGESGCKTDMKYVLEHIEASSVCDVNIKKLCAEMEFIALCLHHYKDMNSLYLLYDRGFSLDHFCDIFYYIKNCNLDPKVLYKFCTKLDVCEYIYYCLYYTDLIFDDDKLKEYMGFLYSQKAMFLINNFGLTANERKPWQIDFFTRLFDVNLREYLDNNLSQEELNKIKVNQTFM